MPSRTFVYTIGRTIRKEMITDKFLEGIKIRTKMIKEATGMVFIIKISGATSSSILFWKTAKIESNVPKKMPRKNPPVMRSREKQTDCQKGAVAASINRRFITAMGEAKSKD